MISYFMVIKAYDVTSDVISLKALESLSMLRITASDVKFE